MSGNFVFIFFLPDNADVADDEVPETVAPVPDVVPEVADAVPEAVQICMINCVKANIIL